MRQNVSRRAFLKFTSGAIVAVGTAALAGCGDSENYVFTGTVDGGGSPSQEPLLFDQQLLEFGADGTAYRLDQRNFTVARLSSSGEAVWTVGDVGADGGIFNFPVALATDADGLIYVADRGNGEIDVLNSDGELVRTFGDADLFAARDMALDAQRGRIYVADGPNHQVVVFDLVGNVLGRLGQFGTETASDLNFPSGVALGPNGELHVVDSGNAEVQVYSADGTYLRVYGSRGDELGQFISPRAIAVDSAGNSWVADAVAGFMTQFDAEGRAVTRFTPMFPDGTPGQPTYLSMSPTGQLIITAVRGFRPA